MKKNLAGVVAILGFLSTAWSHELREIWIKTPESEEREATAVQNQTIYWSWPTANADVGGRPGIDYQQVEFIFSPNGKAFVRGRYFTHKSVTQKFVPNPPPIRPITYVVLSSKGNELFSITPELNPSCPRSSMPLIGEVHYPKELHSHISGIRWKWADGYPGNLIHECRPVVPREDISW